MLNKIFYLNFLIVSFLVVFTALSSPVSVYALDIENERPTPMWGLPSANWIELNDPEQIAKTSYGEPESTIVIRNTAQGTMPDMHFFTDCAINSKSTLSNCFYFLSDSGAKLLNSKTYVNNKMKSAVAVLRYAGVNVYGDSYSASGNFNYWGRHLRQSDDSSNSNALWESSNYSFNPSAQAYWKSDDPNKNLVMTETIDRLKKDSKSLLDSSIVSWGSAKHSWIARPFDGVCGLTGASCLDREQYPEGRIWLLETGKNLEIINGGSVYYNKKGTVLMTGGDLIIGASVTPNALDDSALGFVVVDGDVVIVNNSSNTMTVRASIFAPNGKISVRGNGINLIGSFVANDFDVTAERVNFIQDTRGENGWPPGFRELKLPLVNNQ